MVYCKNYTKACVYGSEGVFNMGDTHYVVKRGDRCVHSIPHTHAGFPCNNGCANCVDVLIHYMKEAIGEENESK